MQSDVGAQPLDFELQVGDGRGALLLRPTVFHGWLQVDRLALAIPDVAFPLDITKGIAQFQEHRCSVTSAALGVDETSLDALLRDRAPILSAAGFQDVRIRLLQGFAEFSGRAYVGEESADFASRAYVSAARRGLRLRLTDARTFGFLRRPAPLLAHDLICVLLGAVAPVTEDLENVDVAVYCGLGDFVVPPLDMFLRTVFPGAGWRIPESAEVWVDEVDLSGGRADISYGTAAAPDDHLDASRDVPALAALEAFREADASLLGGDLGGAIGAYRFELNRDSPHARFLTERLLAIQATRDDTLREAERLARVSLGRWPDFAPAHLALASVAVARGESASAAEHFAAVAKLAEEEGDDEEAVRASLAVARHLREVDGPRATQFYERVLERRPEHAEAADALIARYREEERWAEFVGLWRQRIAGLANDRDRARAHVQLAEVFHDKLDDAERAASELRRAVELDAEYIHAWDTLAATLEELGRDSAAIEALEQLAELQGVKRDHVGEVKTRCRLALLFERIGDDKEARVTYARALELRPDDADLLERIAILAARMGETEEAISTFEHIIEICPASDPHGERAANELLPLFIEARSLERARRHMRRHSIEVLPSVLVSLAELERDSGEPEAAEETLGIAAEALEGVLAADVELARARLCSELQRGGEAAEAFARAYRHAPVSESGIAAARELVEIARAQSDDSGEMLWLRALLGDGSTLEDRGELALRLAELHQAGGDATAALACLEDALESGTDAERARPLHADILGALGEHRGRAGLFEEMAGTTAEEEDQARHLVGAARAYLAAGDAASALARAREAYALVPDDPDVKRAFGEAAWRAREWEEIAAAYDALLPEAAPEERATCALRLGLALERQGRQEAALGCFRTAIELPDASGAELAEAWRNLAELCVRLGDYAGAAEAYESAARDERTDQGPNQRALLFVRAAELLYRRKGAAKEALARLDAALALAPDHMPSLDAFEAIHAETGNYAEVAATLWKKIQVSEDGSPQERALLTRLLELQASVLDRPEEASRSCERLLEIDADNVPALRYKASGALRQDDLEEAEALLARLEAIAARGASSAVADDERSAERLEVLATLASVRRRLGRLEEAEASVMQALVLDSGSAQGQLLEELEAIYESSGRFADLAEVLARHADLIDDLAAKLPLVKRRIELYLDSVGDLETAVGVCHAARERWPDDEELAALEQRAEAEAWRQRHEHVTTTSSGAVVRIGLADAGEAGAGASAAMQQSGADRGDADAGSSEDDRALSAAELAEAQAAIAELEGELALLPRDAVSRFTEIRHKLGALHLSCGDIESARHYLELVLAEEPTRVAALELVLDLYSRVREWDRAVDALGRLSRLANAPEDRAERLFQMGEICRLYLRSEERASDAYLKASDLDPNHVPTLRRLVDYYWRTGDLAGLAEVADELEEKSQLFVQETETSTLARVAITAALANDRTRAARSALCLGEPGARALTEALVDCLEAGTDADAVEAGVPLLCTEPGPAAAAVRRELVSFRAEVGDSRACQVLDEILARAAE